jgi:hypothetical protein
METPMDDALDALRNDVGFRSRWAAQKIWELTEMPLPRRKAVISDARWEEVSGERCLGLITKLLPNECDRDPDPSSRIGTYASHWFGVHYAEVITAYGVAEAEQLIGQPCWVQSGQGIMRWDGYREYEDADPTAPPSP